MKDTNCEVTYLKKRRLLKNGRRQINSCKTVAQINQMARQLGYGVSLPIRNYQNYVQRMYFIWNNETYVFVGTE